MIILRLQTSFSFKMSKHVVLGIMNNNPELTTLSLTGIHLRENSFIPFIRALGNNTVLTTLYLMDSSLGAVYDVAIAGLLERNTTLTTLNLCWNHLGVGWGGAVPHALESNTNSRHLILDTIILEKDLV